MTDDISAMGVGVFAEMNMHTPVIRAAIASCDNNRPDVSAVLVAVPPSDDKKLAIRLVDTTTEVNVGAVIPPTVEYIVVPGGYPFLVECRVNGEVVAVDTDIPRAFVLKMLSSQYLLGKDMLALRRLLPDMEKRGPWLHYLANYGAVAIRRFWQEVWYLTTSVSIAAEDELDEAERAAKIEGVRRVVDLLSNIRIQPTNVVMTERTEAEALPILHLFADRAVETILSSGAQTKPA